MGYVIDKNMTKDELIDLILKKFEEDKKRDKELMKRLSDENSKEYKELDKRAKRIGMLNF